MSYGIQAELDWSGKWIPGMDTIKMKVVIPHAGVEYGEWRYRMIALLRNGKEVEVASKRSSGKILPLPPLHPPRPMEMRAAPEKPIPPKLVYRDNTYTLTPEPKRLATIEHDFDIDSDAFSQVRLEFEYFEDVQDESGKGRIELTSEAKKF